MYLNMMKNEKPHTIKGAIRENKESIERQKRAILEEQRKLEKLEEKVEELEKMLEEKEGLIGTVNVGFTIIEQGKKSVIARRDVPLEYQKYKGKVEYVSWAYHITEEGTPSYYWGKYTDTHKQAKKVMEEREETLS